MLVRDFRDCKEIVAIDNTVLRELINPEKDDVELGYSLAVAKVGVGETTSAHRIKSSEVYYILEGEGLMFVDDESQEVHSKQAVYIPPGAVQKIKNTGQEELVFICIVDPAWKAKDEELVEEDS